MGVVEQSQETVEAYLSVLEESYNSFPINQTTVSVPTEEYQSERERADAGCVDLYAKVENAESEVLHLREEDELVLPSARTSEADFEYTVIDSVRESTGVSCRVKGIEQATILGIHDAESDEGAVYRLALVFEGVPESDSPNTDAVWHSTVEVPEIIAP